MKPELNTTYLIKYKQGNDKLIKIATYSRKRLHMDQNIAEGFFDVHKGFLIENVIAFHSLPDYDWFYNSNFGFNMPYPYTWYLCWRQDGITVRNGHCCLKKTNKRGWFKNKDIIQWKPLTYFNHWEDYN